MTSCGTEACPSGPPVRALAHMPHEHQPWLCAVDNILTLKLLHTFHHGSMACTCQEAACAISQDARSVKHRDFCEKIVPSIPAVIDVQTMNEFNQRCHLVAQAVAKHCCIACGHDRPVLEPLAIASSYSKCPSCDEALRHELRNPLSRHTLTHSFPQWVILTARGIRALQVFLWWNLTAAKKPVQWSIPIAKLIFQVRCLDTEDLMLHG